MKRKAANTWVLRRLVLTGTRTSPHAPCFDRCWGNGTSGPRQPGDRWWLSEPAWLAPHGEFRYRGWAVRLGRKHPTRLRAALVVGWVTSRTPRVGVAVQPAGQ